MVDTTYSAAAIIANALRDYGLSDLGDWAWSQYLATGSMDQVFIDLRSQPAYKARFPAMEALARQGKAISEGEYVSYERSVGQLLQQYGIPRGMYDTPQGIAELLVKDVSAAEVNSRLRIAASAAMQAPQEVRDSMQQMYGVDPGHLTAYYLDPDKALPLIEQQWAAAQVSGAAAKQKAAIDAAEAERLAAQGVSYDQAMQGFGQVAATAGLGQSVGGDIADERTRREAAFGDVQAQQKVASVQRGRAAQFQAGGGAVETQSGVSGLRRTSPRVQ